MPPPSNPLAASSQSSSSSSSAPPPSKQSTKRRGAVTSSSKDAPPPSSSSGASAKPKKSKKGGKAEGVSKSKTSPAQGAAPTAFAKVAFRDLQGLPLPENLYLYLRQVGGGDLREFRTEKDGKVKFLAMAELTRNAYVEFKGSEPGTDAVVSDTATISSRERSKELKWVILPTWKRLTRAQHADVADLSALVPGWSSKRYLDFSLPQERSATGSVVFKVVVPSQGGVKLVFADKNGRPLPKGTWVYVGADKKGAAAKVKPLREFQVGENGKLKEVDLATDKNKDKRASLSDLEEVELPDEVDGFKVGYAFVASPIQLKWAEFVKAVDDDFGNEFVRGLEADVRLEKRGEAKVVKLALESNEKRLRVQVSGRPRLPGNARLYVGLKNDAGKYEIHREFGVTMGSSLSDVDLRLAEVDLAAQTGDTRTPATTSKAEFTLPRTVDGRLAEYSFIIRREVKVSEFESVVNANDCKKVTDLADDAQVPDGSGYGIVVSPLQRSCKATKLVMRPFDDSRKKIAGRDADEEAVFEAESDGTSVPVLAVMVNPTDTVGFKLDFSSVKDALGDPEKFYSDFKSKSFKAETKEERDEDEKKSEGFTFSVEAGFAVARATNRDVLEVEYVATHDGCSKPLAEREPKVFPPTGAPKPAPKQRSTGEKNWLVPVTAPDKYPTWIPSFAPNMFDVPFRTANWVGAQRATDLIHKPRIYKVQAVSCADPAQVVTVEVHSLPCWGAARAIKMKPIFNTSLFSISIGPCELKMKLGLGGMSLEQFVGWKIDDSVGRIAQETKFAVNLGELTLSLEFSILSAVTGIPKALLDYIADITLTASLAFGLEGSVTAVDERKYLIGRAGSTPGLSPTTERYMKGGVKGSASFEAELKAQIGPRILSFSVSGSVKVPISATFEYSTEGAPSGKIKRKKSVDREAVKLKLAMRVRVGWIFNKEKSKEWVLMKRSNISFVEEFVTIDSLGDGFAAAFAKELVAFTPDP